MPRSEKYTPRRGETGSHLAIWFLPIALVLLGMSGTWGYLRAADGARGIPVGIFRVQPTLTVTSNHNDNVFASETAQTSDNIVNIRPVVQIATNWRKVRFSSQIGSDIARHEHRSGEDYQDFLASAGVSMSPSRALSLSMEVEGGRNHESRGAPDVATTGATDSPAQWNHYQASGSVTYTQNRLRAIAELAHRINDRPSVSHYWNDVQLTLMLALAPRTSLLTELSWQGIVYDDSSLSRDSQEMGIRAGVRWEATGKTSGEFRIGYRAKEFSEDSSSSTGDIVMSANLTWQPVSRTELSLTGERGFNEGGTTGAYYLSTSVDLALRHQWRSFLTVNSSLGFANNQYSTGRENDLLTGSLGLSYAFPRWLTLDATYDRTSQISNIAGSSYDANQFSISFRGGL